MSREQNNTDFVRTFQQRVGLPADGWAGPKTRQALDGLLSPPAVEAITRVSQAGLDLIKSFEGLHLTAYPDPGSSNGIPTSIGYGATRDEYGRPIKLGTTWTKERAESVFRANVGAFEDGVTAALRGAPVTQGQFDAFVSFSYNVGLDAFRKSTLLKLHLAGDYAGAKDQFGRWTRNDGKVMRGLVRRRAAEAAMYGGDA